MSDPQRPHGLQPSRLLHPWDFSRQEYWSECILFPKSLLHKSFSIFWWLLYTSIMTMGAIKRWFFSIITWTRKFFFVNQWVIAHSYYYVLQCSTWLIFDQWDLPQADSYVPISFSILAYFFFFLNWRIIALQYCVSFCHTSTWISHRSPPSSCVYVFVLLLSHILLFCNPMNCSPTRLLCAWDFPSKNMGVGYHFLLQEIFLTQGSNLSLLLGRRILYHWTNWEVPSLLSNTMGYPKLSLSFPAPAWNQQFLQVALILFTFLEH